MHLCECGCGQATAMAPRNRVDRDQAKGEPMRFVKGHNDGTAPRPRPRRAEWSTMVVEFLCDERRRGERDYNAAWRRAVKAYPPRGRDMGEAVPALFIDDGQRGPDVSLVEFMEFACGQAWHDVVSTDPGQGKALGRFTPSVLASMDDSSEPAGRSFRSVA